MQSKGTKQAMQRLMARWLIVKRCLAAMYLCLLDAGNVVASQALDAGVLSNNHSSGICRAVWYARVGRW